MTEPLRKLGIRPKRNPADIRRARAISSLGSMNQIELAAEYGVSPWQIGQWLRLPEKTLLAKEQAWEDHAAVGALQQREQIGATKLRRRAADVLGLDVGPIQARFHVDPGARERSRQRNKRYFQSDEGMTLAVASQAWRRCHDPSQHNYCNYGGRGIRWTLTPKCPCRADVPMLLAIFREHGWERGLQIDRIDPNGHYEEGNIRFVPPRENCRNMRVNVWVRLHDGPPMVFKDACRVAGVAHRRAKKRRSAHPDWPASKVIAEGWYYCTPEGEKCTPPPIWPQRPYGAPYQ